MPDIYHIFTRFWDDLMARPSGPMAFRFILQPVMASIQGIRDGFKDARIGRTPYFWMVLTDSTKRGTAIKEGMKSTIRVLLLGLGMDLIYQLIKFHAIYPMEAIAITLVIAFLPYLLIRGPAARVARWRAAHALSGKPAHSLEEKP